MDIIINGISIKITKKKMKHMRLYIKSANGEVRLSVPLTKSRADIEKFVISNIDWINRVKAKYVASQPPEKEYINGETVDLWGEMCNLTVFDAKSNRVELIDKEVHLYMRIDSSPTQKKQVIDKWYRQLLYQKIEERLPELEHFVGLKSNIFQVRDMKTRWGTINRNTKKIWFNLQLVKKSPICLDYIIVHELGHILYNNHGVEFKAYMNEFYPNWVEVRKLLNS